MTADQARSTPHSVDIVGDSDIVHEYEGCTSGQWVYTAWQYIPEDYLGQGDFILLSDYSDGGTATNVWAVQIRFDSDQELVESEFDGVNLPMIKGEWVGMTRPYYRPRMDRQKAGEYYTKKINKAMGWVSAPRTRYCPEPLRAIKDFDIKFPIVEKNQLRDRYRMINRELIKINKILSA